MDEMKNAPWAAWLEDAVRKFFEENPDKIALCAVMEDGEVLTGYYHCNAQDKAVMAHHIYTDTMLELVKVNIGLIKEALDEYEGGDEDSEQ